MEVIEVDSPGEVSQSKRHQQDRRAIIKAMIIHHDEFVGSNLRLCQEKRGYTEETSVSLADGVMFTYELR